MINFNRKIFMAASMVVKASLFFVFALSYCASAHASVTPDMFVVEIDNQSGHKVFVKREWQQCALSQTSLGCNAAVGESCKAVVLRNNFGKCRLMEKRTEVRYRIYIKDSSQGTDQWFRKCSQTREKPECPAFTIKARGPRGNSRATTNLTRASKSFGAGITYTAGRESLEEGEVTVGKVRVIVRPR
jgi:hypothetical protein